LIHHVEAKTCPEAWLAASQYLLTQPDFAAHSVILGIETPIAMKPADFRLFDEVDKFLRKHDEQPVVTVAGTIFPAGLYRKHGPAGVFEIYPNEVYPKTKEQWGTYAFRLVRRTLPDGAKMNPLEVLIEKLRRQLERNQALRGVYELNVVDFFADIPLYDAASDSTRTLSHPCLSHLSFRIHERRSLMLTALYRSHYYVRKTLGNLLGLAQLQAFVAKETGLRVGPLICHSTFAILDRETGKWNMRDVEKLVENCQKAAENRAA
jgi:hypothetical protein